MVRWAVEAWATSVSPVTPGPAVAGVGGMTRLLRALSPRAVGPALGALLAVLSGTGPRELGAQQRTDAPAPPRTSTIWYGGSIGRAGNRVTCDICTTSRDYGLAIAIAAGTYARPQLRVGIEGARWSFDGAGVDESVLSLGVVAHLLPDVRRGLYLLGGIGWSGYRAGDFAYDAPRATVGVGWDRVVAGGVSVGALLALDAASFGAIRTEDATVARDVGLSSIRLALQLRRN